MTPLLPADAERKRAEGRYYTLHNPFDHPAFRGWAARAGLPGTTVLEPFAGAAHLLRALDAIGLGGPSAAYDIAPADPSVQTRDTLADFPAGLDVVVTNPPYLARNSAARRGLPFPQTAHPDLYLHCLDLCLRHARFVAAILPDSFLQADRLQDRCETVVSLPVPMFGDTEHPVCLALFGDAPSSDIAVWRGAAFLGHLSDLQRALPVRRARIQVVFNVPDGPLGLRAVDGHQAASIRFVPGAEIPSGRIKGSSRSLTRLTIDGIDPARLGDVAAAANAALEEMRARTGDVFLTAFKGTRADGRFRRRLDFALARALLHEAALRTGAAPAA
jgi:hypothetical protein